MRDAIIIIGFAFVAPLLLAGAALYSVQGLQRIVDSDHIEILKLREELARLSAPAARSNADARETVEAWRAALESEPEGSPKHTAYLNRLRRAGAL